MDYTKDVNLKKLIAKIIKENDINLFILCRNAGVKYDEFAMWMNGRKGYSMGHEHFEFKLINKIMTQLGVTIRVSYVIHKRDYEYFKFLREARVNKRIGKNYEEIELLKKEYDEQEENNRS